ncbi:hypothetical protein TNIN_175711 [Trichonephila inaurata madagascariensis]|uniref:Uncharacterized protein n=1 Tax=Trichonephila inaurata madagascariensis TaxID=2747483 RepID=A0A8X6YRI6_9ARAC|nr:hypothetical protein TNIN_175711 [Trichonephila inaurata madagascariensis]
MRDRPGESDSPIKTTKNPLLSAAKGHRAPRTTAKFPQKTQKGPPPGRNKEKPQNIFSSAKKRENTSMQMPLKVPKMAPPPGSNKPKTLSGEKVNPRPQQRRILWIHGRCYGN